jgi:hypothetical protein
VLDLQELEAVLEHMEMLQAMSESLREQQFQAILELGVELQDILREIKKLHNAYPLPEGNLATPAKSIANTLIASLTPQGNMMGLHCKKPESLRTHERSERKRKNPPCPPQTPEPEKTDQTPHLPTNFIRDATASEKTNQTQHFSTSETLKPRKDISCLIIDADAVKPNPRARITAKYHHCHLQHISPPDSLWTLYEEIKGELAAAQYTRLEIREYIKDLQSHYKPSPAEPSTKGPPIPEASYIAPSPDPSCCPRSSPGETTPSAMEPTSRTQLTAKDKEYYLHLQHISSPHAL